MVTRVKLPSGDVTLLDDEDVHLLQGYIWWADRRSNTTYVRGRKAGDQRNNVYLHIHILGEKGVDHINGNGLDNRKVNLRRATQGQNLLNSTKKREHKRFKGVYFDRRHGTWWAQLYVDKQSFFGGRHKTELDAARAYNKLARKHHGQFARLNDV